MSLSGLVSSARRRIRTIKTRTPEYVHWKRAALVLLILLVLFGGSLYGIYRFRGWKLSAGIFVVAIAVVTVYRRNRFVSPSSVRLQTTLLRLIQRLRRLRNRDKRQMMRNAVESRPVSGAVVAPVLGIVAFPLITAVYTLPLQFKFANTVDETLWAVHASVTGFSFVVLIFFWEYLRGEFDNVVLIRTAVRYTWSLHIIYFLLSANVVIGGLALLEQGNQAVFVGVQAVLFLATIFGLYWLYHTIYTVMVRETLPLRVKRMLEEKIGVILTESDQETWVAVVNRQLNEDYPQLALPNFTGGKERVTAGELGLSGEVTDIHLHRLHDLLEEASALDVEVEQLPVLGRSYNDDDDLFVYQGDPAAQEAEQMRNRLRRAIKVR
ncbi:hypothetical protein NDI76_19640 [Halogeometricum sp. S1BR25-6]|uniref:Uncharacterized protein n=1 Tax=Halogeometricum salsisoli TaxID=2950536 RepID=A0ABU2GJG0_9EURY|nr:hypothetical protein [Halogeometricum sp. S1BR25-6]MDS0300963.1 hypothetical protein [Halogeometricum sp. S1BR25-6]